MGRTSWAVRTLLFPACAGVIRGENKLGGEDIAFPRVCGGDPDAEQDNTKPITLFPACAGVIPSQKPFKACYYSFPRVCGGDPSPR